MYEPIHAAIARERVRELIAAAEVDRAKRPAVAARAPEQPVAAGARRWRTSGRLLHLRPRVR
jgi:hypothetical protein